MRYPEYGVSGGIVRKEPIPPIHSLHEIVEGVFDYEGQPDMLPARAPFPRLPFLANQGTSHPDRRLWVRASDGFATVIETALKAPTIGSVFEAVKDLFHRTRFMHIEVRQIT